MSGLSKVDGCRVRAGASFSWMGLTWAERSLSEPSPNTETHRDGNIKNNEVVLFRLLCLLWTEKGSVWTVLLPIPASQNKLAWVPYSAITLSKDIGSNSLSVLVEPAPGHCQEGSLPDHPGPHVSACEILSHRDMAFSCPAHHFGWCLHLNRYTVELSFPQDGIHGYKERRLCLLTGEVQNHPTAPWPPLSTGKTCLILSQRQPLTL